MSEWADELTATGRAKKGMADVLKQHQSQRFHRGLYKYCYINLSTTVSYALHKFQQKYYDIEEISHSEPKVPNLALLLFGL